MNTHKAKTQHSQIIAYGREVVISRYGQPVAKLVPIKRLEKNRQPETAKGKIMIRKSFFDPLPDDIQNEFLQTDQPKHFSIID